jgi:hypothetical protein
MDGFHFHLKRFEDRLDIGRVRVLGAQGDKLTAGRRGR